jgi:hypothetical protein
VENKVHDYDGENGRMGVEERGRIRLKVRSQKSKRITTA